MLYVAPDAALPWPIPYEAVSLTAEMEGLRLKAYRCPAGIPTIGRGHTGPDVVIGKTVWTVEQADAAFLADLEEFTRDVEAECTNPPTPNQLGALVSLAYNIGMGWRGRVKPKGAKDGFRQSTVLKRHNAGDTQAAARAFSLWNKATVNGVLQELAGLTSRRAAEAALYLKPEDDAPRDRMPQAVNGESNLAASPIARSGATTAGAGLVVAATEAQDQLGVVGSLIAQVKGFVVQTLGIPPEWMLPAVLVLAGAAAVYWRARQRRDGWA